MSVDEGADDLVALRAAGDSPLMRSFPQGAVFTWDRDLRYLSAGGHGLGDVGLSREMLEGRTIFEVFPPEVVATIEPLYRAALHGRSTTFDVPYRGHIYAQHLSPVTARDGTVVAGMGFTQDVTSVRAAETALRESEERARLSFEHAPIGQALVELDGRWRHVNSALTKLTGYSEAELLGMTFQDITHPDDLDADLEQLEQLVAGKIDAYQMEKRYFTADGGIVWVLLAVSLVRSEDDSPLYFVAQIQNITELKRQHEALQDMIAMLAHDLRSPLTAISGFADLLLSEWDEHSEADRLAYLERIATSSVGMGRLLENILTVSTVDADSLRANPTEVRVEEVVRDSLGMLSVAPPSVDLSGLTPVVARVDRAHLEQVMTNLLTNAVKYGGGTVSVSTDEVPEGVRIRVVDHGGGVPAEFVPHLFDRFTRAEKARTGPRRGTGLGLYIVRTLLAANRADVSYSDTPGGGATFTVLLPPSASHVGHTVPVPRVGAASESWA